MNDNTIYALIFLLVLIVVFKIIGKSCKHRYYKKKIIQESSETPLHKSNDSVPFSHFAYEPKKYFFSSNEYFFYKELERKLPTQYIIFPKVRVGDIVNVRSIVEYDRAALSKVTSKHFDFLIMSKDFLTLILIVELDDKSHDINSATINRDEFINDLINSKPMYSKLEIIRVRCKKTTNGFDYTEAVNSVLEKLKSCSIEAICPLCHSKLEIKTGPYGEFWGCPNYYSKTNPCDFTHNYTEDN
ncbi:DUF2726 domain-containing protein [Sinanaerobacter sp. ZZT-01]|uniref:DUF2726 domain-containing protein n=1 Tax=Sinanaerobacter sp. ZZT-01 TaxID=3111540 RepID=UPI002D793D84|nr:DUF2726 domain-containing protein [Sinanaerobacter sp. ZZT-01]WRR93352.1 DUF2726 domain-containing protein [Sinanaerobacter sp. ZZT-01]